MNLFEGMFSVVDQALGQYITNTATDHQHVDSLDCHLGLSDDVWQS